MPDKIKILQGWYEEIWIKGNVEAISNFLAPNARTRGIIGDVPFSPEDMAELVTMMRERLGPIAVEIPVTIEQGDWLSALIEIRSHAVDSGDPIQVFGQIMVRFENDKMCEIYSGLDSIMLFEQLGMLPDNALAIMLAGTRLR